VGNKVLNPRDCKNADEILVYDVPLKVYNISGLLGMKLGVVTSENLPRPKDITDIYNLLGVCESQGLDAETILGKFTDEEKGKLMDVFAHVGQSDNKYIVIPPTARLLSDFTQLYLDDNRKGKIVKANVKI
jgi:hypothetical protein